MRLATVRSEGTTFAAVGAGDGWRALPAKDLSELISSELFAAPSCVGEPGRLLPDAVPVLPLPRPGKVICCGLNYADHIIETGREVPTYPTLFAKYADTLIGSADDVVLPAGLEIDWEAELVVVVGAHLREASPADAADAISGYTIANDVSVRDWQRRTLQWFQGKVWDRTTPLGPVVVTPDEVDPSAGMHVRCLVNGEERQSGNTKNLVFDAAHLLSYISTFTTLRPGDLVLTGTPGGVGMGMTPPTYLADGDLLETEISGIGTLRNRIRITDAKN